MSETALVPQQPKAEITKPEPQSGKLSRIAAFTPTNLTEAIALSKLIAGSDLAPKDFKGKPANVLIAMQMGAEVGLAPMQSLQNIAVINGRPSLWGDAALGVVQVHPEYEWHKEKIEGDGDKRFATFEIKRKGQEPYVRMFGVADAKRASLWGKAGPWQSYPDRMLQMRARGFGLRDKFADALRGLSIAEEAMDIAPDVSDVKRKREEATLDVAATVSQLSPSTEPNRGHGDEGLQRSQPPESQETKKQDDWVCSDCSKTNSHDPTCKHYEKWMQDNKTSKPTTEVVLRIDKVDKAARKKDGGDYLILHVTDAEQLEWVLYVWDKKFHEYLKPAVGKMMVCEFSQSKKGDKTYCSLEHIHNLGGVTFVSDAPAVTGQMPEEELF